MSIAIDKFIKDAGALPDSSDWLQAKRTDALARFDEQGIPTTRHEDWKYTNLRALSSKQFELAPENVPCDMTAQLGSAEGIHRLVFVGGTFCQALSNASELPEGLTLKPMRQALADHADQIQQTLSLAMPEGENAFAALNMGYFRDGVYLHLEAEARVEAPIELVFISSGEQTLAMPRSLIVLDQGASASIIERQLSDEDSTALNNSATEILLAENSTLDYNLIQLQGKKTTHIGGTWVRQAAGSTLSTRTITLGGALVRNELNVSLNGEGAEADCVGLYFGRQRQHIDNHTTIRHAAPSCTSRELYKGILDDRARGVFHGRIVVDPDAQLTESEQENPNLLLSRDAEIDTKPQLEIYADDVKCSHGATVGELDAKQLFYLQSRGIDKASARTLLTYAFAAEVINEIKIDHLRDSLTERLSSQMNLEGVGD